MMFKQAAVVQQQKNRKERLKNGVKARLLFPMIPIAWGLLRKQLLFHLLLVCQLF